MGDCLSWKSFASIVSVNADCKALSARAIRVAEEGSRLWRHLREGSDATLFATVGMSSG